jgi:hypothetical protein
VWVAARRLDQGGILDNERLAAKALDPLVDLVEGREAPELVPLEHARELGQQSLRHDELEACQCARP